MKSANLVTKKPLFGMFNQDDSKPGYTTIRDCIQLENYFFNQMTLTAYVVKIKAQINYCFTDLIFTFDFALSEMFHHT